MTTRLTKYPRTPHLSGSQLQRGDSPDTVPFADVKGCHLVVEEKIDGANAAISFGPEGLRLQCRGHYLTGGPRERQFDLFKPWAMSRSADLHDVLGERYIVYGEWCYAKHTVFYDRLPHYFLEFDVLDRESGQFLSTPARHTLLDGLCITHVPVLYEGSAQSEKHLMGLIQHSLYKSDGWRTSLDDTAARRGLDAARVRQQTEMCDLAEGLYLKHESPEHVLGRFKVVRQGFQQTLLDNDDHWHNRPILPNQLAPGVSLY